VSGGGIIKDGNVLAQQESSGTSRAKERDMEAKASKHASKCEHACVRVRARLCVCAWGGGHFQRTTRTCVIGNSAAKKLSCWSFFVSARWEPFGPERFMAADSAREFRRVRAESASDYY
jgi:hypothetical protein